MRPENTQIGVDNDFHWGSIMPESPLATCALVVGHKAESPGAVNADSGITEFSFNDSLALEIESRQTDVRIQRVYRRTLATLPSDINELNPDFTVSLHCNAYNRRTSGSEVLYYHRSEIGKKIAKMLNEELTGALGLRNRGIKAKNAEDRGGFLLKSVRSPCVISEPFFIDNNKDLEAALARRGALADAYATAISKIGAWLTEFEMATVESLKEDKTVNRFHIFFDVPDGALMKFSVTDDNSKVICSAALSDPNSTISTWQSDDIKHPFEAEHDLTGEPHFGLTLDHIFMAQDKATGRFRIEDPEGTVVDQWSYQISSPGKKTHTVNVTFLMA